MNKIIIIFLLPLSLLVVPLCCYAQFEDNYEPIPSIGDEKAILIAEIEASIKLLNENFPRSLKSEIKDIYEDRVKTLKGLLESDYFIDDPEVSALVYGIHKEITSTHPREGYPVRLLVSRSPSVNAYCWGEGTMVINLGLLSRINSESELAFVMAHEMAHQLLDHINQRLINTIEKRNDKDLKKKVEESGKLEVLKSLTYDFYRYTRKNEIQADSLAMVLLSNTKYDRKASQTVLLMLDSADIPENTNKPDLKSFFNFSRYAYKEHWTRKPSSSFGLAGRSNSDYNTDSVKSHPDIADRIRYIDSLFLSGPTSEDAADKKPFSPLLRERLDIELPNSAFVINDYPRAMYFTLQMLKKYPENKYLKTLLARLWVRLYTARKEHTFSNFVPLSNYYPKMMEELYIFLNNLRLTEIGHIAFNYLNRDQVFDWENEEHYQLLWKISNEIKMMDVAQKVEKAYNTKFPDGILSKE